MRRPNDDAAHAAKVRCVSEPSRGLKAILDVESAVLAARPATPQKLAFQSPRKFKHGLKQRGVVEALLTKAGYQ